MFPSYTPENVRKTSETKDCFDVFRVIEKEHILGSALRLPTTVKGKNMFYITSFESCFLLGLVQNFRRLKVYIKKYCKKEVSPQALLQKDRTLKPLKKAMVMVTQKGGTSLRQYMQDIRRRKFPYRRLFYFVEIPFLKEKHIQRRCQDPRKHLRWKAT